MVDEKYKKVLQGKEFILFEGLLDEAHKKGLMMIRTEQIQSDDKRIVFRAVVNMRGLKEGEPVRMFAAFGDAENITEKFAHRKAETCAVARALRWATNNASEESNDP